MIKVNYYMLNGCLVENLEIDNDKDTDIVVYEVMRIIDGFPLFFSDHYERLIQSCKLMGATSSFSRSEILSQIITLCKANDIDTGNMMLKIVIGKDFTNILAYFIPHNYPTLADYKNGVLLGVLEAQRTNPEAKVLQSEIRYMANRQIQQTGVYEVLLIDGQKKITEGSRSNFFLVKKNALYTTPLFKVLKGITLAKVLDIAVDLGIEVHFADMSIEELHRFDAMFLTGTSPQVLPVANVGNVAFDVGHPIIIKMMGEFQNLAYNDIETLKKSYNKSS